MRAAIEGGATGGSTMTLQTTFDPHAQLRALYQALLSDQECFDEFKRLLQLYDFVPTAADEEETAEAAAVRERLNRRIRSWIGRSFDGLSTRQTLQWRAIIVEERFNV